MSLKHVPLHVHTEYSLLDGASRIPQLVSRAKELQLPGLAITDHGVMYGCYELLEECKKQGVKPILGSEVYVINGDHTDKSQRVPIYHLVLLAKNNIGYKNLCEIASESSINGFYYKPRISKEYLAERSEGLVCMTACLGGEVPNLILNDKYEEAKKAALFFQDLFGEDFYLEIQDHGIEEEIYVNQHMRRLSEEIGAKVITTNDSHFTRDCDAIAHDAILCMQTGKFVTDFPRMRFSGQEYLKSGDELYGLFDNITDRSWLGQCIEDNSLEVLEKIGNYDELLNPTNHIPQSPVPEGETNETYLRKVCYEKAEQRYGEMRPDVVARLDYELSVIEDKGFAGYFLIVADFINYARQNLIPVGPGRGSAAGSIVAYVLGITNIDPLRFNLLFERFLNPERESMPDIDTDFCIERRGEVIEYVRELYGADKVAQIITFNKLTSKAVIKDVARVLQYPYKDADQLAKTIPVIRGKPKKIDWMIDNHPEFQKVYNTDDRAKEVADLAMNIEGTNKTFGVHAAGVIIGDVPLTDVVPLSKSKEGAIITQYSMDHLATLGLLKMDFLGLRNLTMIQEAIDIIKDTTGEVIDIDAISLTDEKTYELLSSGELSGVFQLETSAGMKQVARDMQPNCIEDVSAIIALYRPGPLDTGMIDEFIDRKRGRKPIEYAAPELEEILNDTYGTMVYQEQIMQIAQKLAGFSLGEADLLRRAMGKKKPEEMLKYKEMFLNGCKERNIVDKVSEDLFEMMMAFAEYCFNKSHSAAYAFISYQTAWLKANYPVQYLAALMNSVGTGGDKIRFYIAEAQRMGMQVLIPDINVSGFSFTASPERKEILFGIGMIKGISENAVREIIRARKEEGEFTSLLDLCKKVDLKLVTRKTLENLIYCGAFDRISKNSRRGLLKSLDQTISQAEKAAHGQTDLFGMLSGGDGEDNSDTSMEIDIVDEFSDDELAKFEREYLGFYVTCHPLDIYRDKLKYFTTNTLIQKENFKDGQEVSLGVLITTFTKKMTKSNKLMGIAFAEDLTGNVELVFFSNILERFQDYLTEDQRILVRGKVQLRNETEVSIIVNTVQPLENLAFLEIDVTEAQNQHNITWTDKLLYLKDTLVSHTGNIPVVLNVGKDKMILSPQLWVSETDDLYQDISSKKWFKANLQNLY